MTRPTRRRLLGVAGAASVGAVAGCLGSSEDPGDGPSDGGDGTPGEDGTDGGNSTDGDDGADEPDEPPEPTGTVLGDISIHNLHEKEHKLSVMVEMDGETQTWPEPTLEAGPSTTTLDREWPDSGGPFMVRVRMDGGQFRDVRPGQWNDPACVNLVVVIDAAGSLNVAGDTTGGPCAE